MTRSCYHPTRGYCFCEFCIADHLKNAYVQANNSPNEPINFKNFKKSTQLSPIEIYCKQFSKRSSNEELSKTNSQRAYTPLNSPNNNQQANNKVDLSNDNQTKFLRILSDRLTQLADQQAAYIINSKSATVLSNFNKSSLLQRRSLNNNINNNIKLNLRPIRIRSSMSESSGYETGEPIESPLPNASINTTHCSSAGMLFNSTGLSINIECKNRIKFGPEDILSTTNPMLLFSSNLVDESTVCSTTKKSSRRRRKSNGNRKESNTDNECSNKTKNNTNVSSKPLSNVTNTISK